MERGGLEWRDRMTNKHYVVIDLWTIMYDLMFYINKSTIGIHIYVNKAPRSERTFRVLYWRLML